MFVGMLLAAPWVLIRMPADQLVRSGRGDPLPRRIARNVLGVLLIAAGIAMLVLPGQGILTILVGLALLDVPVKRRLLCRLLRRRSVEQAIQRLRERAGQPPLIVPTGAT